MLPAMSRAKTILMWLLSLNLMFAGDLGPMKDVWSHADDVTYMGPDGGF